MSAAMTPERVAEIRAWLAWEYRASLGERGEQIAAELLAEVDRLTADRIKGKRCKANHTVELTDLPAGSRIRGKSQP